MPWDRVSIGRTAWGSRTIGVMKVCTVRETQEVHRRATEELGLTETILLENAGHAAFHVLRRELGESCKRVVILCGGGALEGVGFVLARHLHAAGTQVKVLTRSAPRRIRGAASVALEVASRCGIPVDACPDPQMLREAMAGCCVLVDALTGLDGASDLSGWDAKMIAVIRDASCPILSLGIASGVCGDTGQVQDIAVQADATVSFGVLTRGHVLPPGASLCGRLYLAPLAYPPRLQSPPEVDVALSEIAPLPARSPHGHKGSFGDTLFIAGAAGYLGAPSFAAMASLRSGAGYARLACPRSVVPTLASLAPEVVFLPQQETEAGSLARVNLPDLLSLARDVDFVVVGPGLSLHPETQETVQHLVREVSRPLLIDGDGITAIAQRPDLVRQRSAPTVLTPHPGEMSRLLGVPTREVLADPIAAAVQGARDLEADIVLKGYHSVVARQDGHASINMTGNDGMGTAGSGDVLTGTIAAMSGLGLAFHEAVVAGVYLHGLAGDYARESVGADGMTARDILQQLPKAMNAYRKNRGDVISRHAGVTVVR